MTNMETSKINKTNKKGAVPGSRHRAKLCRYGSMIYYVQFTAIYFKYPVNFTVKMFALPVNHNLCIL